MPEGPSNVEIAHHVGQHARAGEPEHARDPARRREAIIEIAEAVVLAFVAIATAWAGYQTGRWDGRQAHLYGLSGKYRLQQDEAANLSGQQRLYDSSTFGFWYQEKVQGDEAAAKQFERRFRPEYRPAFAAWLRIDPLHNPKAPPGPALMPQYHNAAADRAAAAGRRATAAFDAGTQARERGDKYLRVTVLLATVLFLIAVAQKFRLQKVRVGLLVVSGVLLLIGLAAIGSYPRA
jgi:hypothetical protein